MIKNLQNDAQGTSLVELALLLPVFLLMIVGALDYGSAFMRKMEISNAAKAGVQYAMVRKPQGGVTTGIQGAVVGSLDGSGNDSTEVDVTFLENCFGTMQAYSFACTDEDMTTFINVVVTETYRTPYLNYSWITGDFVISESSRIQLN